LRHTSVAFWIAAGASPVEIARRAGHTSVVTVLDRYGHLLPKEEDTVTERLDAMARAGAEEAARDASTATVTSSVPAERGPGRDRANPNTPLTK